ncbi:hypothetical protein WN55_10849 [Dufourea novaeangliae]|uniref:Uncharacterized protein n=1 Tax=Dufourea novaeangliae TaxID=178035 RepID=A0A154P9L8_DUFNO|nr:hypothetical protein WN55_10849 [Dufourea novaeangliae]
MNEGETRFAALTTFKGAGNGSRGIDDGSNHDADTLCIPRLMVLDFEENDRTGLQECRRKSGYRYGHATIDTDRAFMCDRRYRRKSVPHSEILSIPSILPCSSPSNRQALSRVHARSMVLIGSGQFFAW